MIKSYTWNPKISSDFFLNVSLCLISSWHFFFTNMTVPNISMWLSMWIVMQCQMWGKYFKNQQKYQNTCTEAPRVFASRSTGQLVASSLFFPVVYKHLHKQHNKKALAASWWPAASWSWPFHEYACIFRLKTIQGSVQNILAFYSTGGFPGRYSGKKKTWFVKSV